MKLKTSLILLTAGLLTGAHAGEVMVASGKGVEPAVQPAGSEKSIYDKIWGLATLYKNDENDIIQEFALQGRLQLQWADGSSDQGDYGSADRPEELLWGDIEVRRWRLGFKSKIFRQFKLEGQIDVNPTFERETGANPDIIGEGFYRQIYDLYLTWAPNDQFNISVGKFKANFFSVEQFTSSKEILTFERTLLSNTLFTGELTGVRVNGKIDNFIYTLAGYAGDQQREFSEFEVGAILQAGIGYDISSMTGMDKAIVKFDYQHSTDSKNSGGGALFDHSFSLNSTWEKGRWTVFTDTLGGTGVGNQGDVYGFHVIPAVFIADGLQLVARYQYAHGDNDGLRLQSRYERLAPDLTDGGRGDEYQAAYLGLNYYLYGHKLKLMGGVEYHNMSGGGDGGDFDGWTTLVGLRMFF